MARHESHLDILLQAHSPFDSKSKHPIQLSKAGRSCCKMPPAHIDAMIQDVSNHMARSQLLRQRSANSNASTGSKRGATRVAKVNSLGNSPHSIQRRRTTASHSARTTHSVIQSLNPHIPEKKEGDGYLTRGSLPSARPMSWHPGSGGFGIEQFPANEPAMGNTIAGFQNLAVNNILPRAHENASQHSLQMDSIYSVNAFAPLYGQSTACIEGYGVFGPDVATAYSSIPPHNLAAPNHYQTIPTPYPCGYYSSMDALESDWPSISNLPTHPHQTPDFLPIQHPTETHTPSNQNLVPEPQIIRKRSKELVGMGLYDPPDRANPSSVDFSLFDHIVNPHRNSTGKGLKLEETWHPPNSADEDEESKVAETEEEDEEEEEAYSTDEADEDFLPPLITPTPRTEPHSTGFYPTTYADLSNQSFFFDADDPYTNCLTSCFEHQAIQMCTPQPKTPESSTCAGGDVHGNILWF